MGKHGICAALLAVLALTSSDACAAGDTYRLPDGPGQAVITLDFQGGRLRRLDDAPTLSIYADGRVVMPRLYAHARAYEGRISQQRLQALLDRIIVANKFFQFDAKRVAAKLDALPGGRRPLPMHLATTELVVHANGQRKAVRSFALGHQVLVEETAQLLAVRRTLEQLMASVILGGDAEVGAWLAVANRELANTLPAEPPLALEDLESGTVRSDGSVFVRFARSGPSVKQPVAVSISIADDGRSSVTVSPQRAIAGADAPVDP